MADIIPNEGRTIIFDAFYLNSFTDRTANLLMGVFTNTSGLSEASVWANINQPTGTGYAEKTLTDGSWTISNGVASFAKQTWTAGGDWSAPVYGTYIRTQGAQSRLISISVSGVATTILNTKTYNATPSITLSSGADGLTCYEGLDVMMDSFFNLVARDANSIKLHLIGDPSALTASSLYSNLTLVTGTGSTAKTITDATFGNATALNVTLATQTWTATADFSPAVYGYAVTVDLSAVPKLLSIDNNGISTTRLNGQSYAVNLSDVSD